MQEIDIRGLDDAIKKLKKLEEKVQKKVARGTARAAAKPFVEEAKRRAPVKTGNLRKSIGIIAKRSKTPGIVRFWVGPRSGRHLKSDGFYGAFVEYGHQIKKDKKVVGTVSPKPFIRPAAESALEKSINAAKKYFIDQVEKEIGKL